MNKFKQSVFRFFADKHGKLAVVQFPNPPLIAWLLATGVAHIVHSGLIHAFARVIAMISLVLWAALEVATGVSPFRRVLGAAVLLLMFVSLLRTL